MVLIKHLLKTFVLGDEDVIVDVHVVMESNIALVTKLLIFIIEIIANPTLPHLVIIVEYGCLVNWPEFDRPIVFLCVSFRHLNLATK